jgi:hypothetical protein
MRFSREDEVYSREDIAEKDEISREDEIYSQEDIAEKDDI